MTQSQSLYLQLSSGLAGYPTAVGMSGKMAVVLLIGSGGREHAIAWKLAQSQQVCLLKLHSTGLCILLNLKSLNVKMRMHKHDS